MKRINQILAISFLIATFAVIASAQSFRGTLVGRVTDSAGAGVPNATVIVTHAATNQVRTVTTNDSGEYVAAQLQPGEYSVKIDATGFKSTINQNIVLQTDETRRVNVALDVGSVNETVTVESEAPVINSETPEKGEVIVQRQVQELPLNVRDFTDLAKLVPGIYARPTEDDQGQGLASAGTRTDSTNFILDGVSNRDDRNGAVGVNTSVDSIQEFKVSTSTYSAEYGRMAGAQISVVSKSGTNRYSGSLFEFVRNDFFDAKNALMRPGDEKTLKRHQFGGTFGGPLPFINFGKGDNIYDSGKDKMFFFASFEQLREVRSSSANTVAPNADWARGDFRNVRNGADGIPGNADDYRVMCLRRTSNPMRPARVECPTPNVIPLGPVAGDPDLLYASPVSLALLNYLPRANGTDPLAPDEFAYTLVSNTLPRNLFSVKIDRKINEANSFYFRYSLDNRDAYQPQAGRFNYPGFLRVWDYKNSSYAFGDTHIFTPSLINDFRIGFGIQDRKTVPENNDQDYVAMLGIPGLPSASEPSVWGFPAIRIDGFPDTGDSANVPFNYLYKNLSISDSVTWVKGSHSIKAGVEILRPNYVESDIRNVRGDFRFRGRFSYIRNSLPVDPQPDPSIDRIGTNVWSFADFLYGIVDSTQRQIGTDPADLVAWQSAFYVQDNWRVAPWLTLNLGVRYDYTPYLYEKSNLLSNFIPELGVSACAGGEFRDEEGTLICVDAASLGLPRALVETDKNNWAPRFGFALKPFKDDKTVIRGGAGIYYSTETINPARQMLALNYPYLNRQQFSRSSTADILRLTFADPFPDDFGTTQGVATPQGIPTDSQTPEVYQFNLTLERELTKDLALEVGYVGSQGRHLGVRYNLNYQYPTGNIVGGIPEPRRAFPALGDITYQAQVLNSTYNAGQVAIRRRAKNGLTLLASYTFGKAMDMNSNTNNSTTGSQRNPQDIHDFGEDWGLADYHRTHQFSGSFNYDLPFGRGRAFFSSSRGWTNALLGGWQVNGIVSMSSGRPFTPVFSTLDTASGRPDLVGDPMANIPAGLYFNPNAFERPVATEDDPTRFGNSGRNILIGPDYKNFDVSLFKNIRLAERAKLQLRWELFNVLNHPNFQVPQHIIGVSDTGKIRSTLGEGREMQFAVRLTF